MNIYDALKKKKKFKVAVSLATMRGQCGQFCKLEMTTGNEFIVKKKKYTLFFLEMTKREKKLNGCERSKLNGIGVIRGGGNFFNLLSCYLPWLLSRGKS